MGQIIETRPLCWSKVEPDACGEDWKVPNGGHIFRVETGYILVAPITPSLKDYEES